MENLGKAALSFVVMLSGLILLYLTLGKPLHLETTPESTTNGNLINLQNSEYCEAVKGYVDKGDC